MHLAVTARVLGFLLMIFSLTMLTPIIVAWIYGEQTSQTFLSAFAITLLVGLLFWFPAKNKKGRAAYPGWLYCHGVFLVSTKYLWCSAANALRGPQSKFYGCSV